MAESSKVEKFSAAELAALRNELLDSGLDSWQAAELVATFLSGRGYGADPENLRTAVKYFEGVHCSVERMQEVLERVALVM